MRDPQLSLHLALGFGQIALNPLLVIIVIGKGVIDLRKSEMRKLLLALQGMGYAGRGKQEYIL